MNIISKLNSIFSFKEKKVEGAEVWMVYWYAFEPGYTIKYPTVKRKSKAFLSKDDAEHFVDKLKRCLDILQFSIGIDIEIEKQK